MWAANQHPSLRMTAQPLPALARGDLSARTRPLAAFLLGGSATSMRATRSSQHGPITSGEFEASRTTTTCTTASYRQCWPTLPPMPS